MNLDFSKKDQVASDGGPPISFPLLQLITEARSEHGMRVQDYTRYRHYCASKVHRLRELLQLTYSDGKQKAEADKAKTAKSGRAKKPKKAQVAAAQSAAAKGHGNVFTPQTLDVSKVKNERSAQLLLFESERAWAYSQELRRETDHGDQKRGYSRLRRAVKWSTSLYELVDALSSRFDVYARAETAAYKVIIKANAIFDHGKWDKNLEVFSVARLLLNAIAENSPTSRAEALANSFVDSSEGQMRYCVYQLQLTGQDLDEIAKSTATPEVCEEVCPGYATLIKELAHAKTSGDETKKQSVSLSWHGHQIPVRNPELLDTITNAQDEEALLRDSIKVEALGEQAADAQSKKTGSKTGGSRTRLSHAQRKAKKRDLTQNAAGSARASSSTARLGRGGRTELDPFDRALSAMTDAESVARKLVDDNAETLSKNAGSRQELASKDLQTAHDYIFYRLLALRVWRNSRLVAEVERRAEKRDKRALDNAAARLSKKTPKAAPRNKSGTKKKSAMAKPPVRKDAIGAKTKKTGSSRKGTGKPARSGTRALRTRQALGRENRTKAVAVQKAKRRGARAVPSLAKLLDSAENSLAAMGSIALIESEPDVSSLVEAKAAWFRSEILRHLARAFTLSGAHAEAVLLLTRAQLYIRQARQASDLAEDVEEEDSDFPPRIKSDDGDDTVFDHSDHVLSSLKRSIQQTMCREQQMSKTAKDSSNKKGGSSSMAGSRAGQTLQEMARKHIDFDPVSLEEARNVPSDVRAEVENEKNGITAPKATAKPAKKAAAPTASAVPSQANVAQEDDDDDDDVFQDQDDDEHAEDSGEEGDFSLAYDPGNATDDEEGVQASQTPSAQKKGWLGGWFGRG